MLLDVQEREVQMNYEGLEFDFRLDNNSPVLFQILREKMYSDPIRAVVVEIISNSRDANRESGCEDTPVSVYLPGDFVVFSDRGIGISPDRMENIFCVYGASTKTGDNKQGGGFGLGAKTPFGISSNFFVETVYDNTRYYYSVFLDETNRGKIKLMDQVTTQGESGTSIRIPIKSSDRHTVKDRLFTYTKFWQIQPNFVGHPAREPLKFALEGTNWRVYLEDTDGFNVLVDDIPYKDYNHSIPRKVMLTFKTGDLSLSSNRETLFYNDKTNNAIKQALENYNREVVEQIEQQVNKIDSFSDVIKIIETLPDSHSRPRKYIWRESEFFYPLSESLLAFDTGTYHKTLQRRHTKVFNDNVEDNAFIVNDKIAPLSSYDSQRIKVWLASNNLKFAYLLPPDHSLPVVATPLTSIKVPRGPTAPKGQKPPRDYVRARTPRYKKTDAYPIKRTSPICYVTKDIERYRYNRFPLPIVEISPKDETYIVGEANWIHINDYLQTHLYDNVSEAEIQEIADNKFAVDEYNKFDFLKDYHDDFKFLDVEPLEKKYPDTVRSLVTWLVGQGKVKPKNNHENLYKKYPMLELTSSCWYEDHKNKIKSYVNLVNLNKTGE